MAFNWNGNAWSHRGRFEGKGVSTATLSLRRPRTARCMCDGSSVLGPWRVGSIQRCKTLRIVTLGFRVKDHSRGRFATPADFPRHDFSPY
jgi:hypothetical protein